MKRLARHHVQIRKLPPAHRTLHFFKYTFSERVHHVSNLPSSPQARRTNCRKRDETRTHLFFPPPIPAQNVHAQKTKPTDGNYYRTPQKQKSKSKLTLPTGRCRQVSTKSNEHAKLKKSNRWKHNTENSQKILKTSQRHNIERMKNRKFNIKISQPLTVTVGLIAPSSFLPPPSRHARAHTPMLVYNTTQLVHTEHFHNSY